MTSDFSFILSLVAALTLPSLPPTVTEVKVNTNEMPYQCYQYLQSRCANDGLRTHPSVVPASLVCILKSGWVLAMPLKGYQGREGRRDGTIITMLRLEQQNTPDLQIYFTSQILIESKYSIAHSLLNIVKIVTIQKAWLYCTPFGVKESVGL